MHMGTPTTTAQQVAASATQVKTAPAAAAPKPAPTAQPPSASPPSNPNKFTFEEDATMTGVIVTIYGGKGVGKTTAALSLSGKKYIISLDGKTQRIKETLYRDDDSVVVLDGRKHYDDSNLPKMPAAGKMSCAYIEFLLDTIKQKGDAQWIMFDYLPKLAEMAEMKMRHDHSLGATQGFAERSWWKERNATMRGFLRRAIDSLAQPLKDRRTGVVYITYIDNNAYKNLNPETDPLVSLKKPNYTDVVEQETDIVLFAAQIPNSDANDDNSLPRFKNVLEVESNKVWEPTPAPGTSAALRNGDILDLSGGRKLRDLVKDL